MRGAGANGRTAEGVVGFRSSVNTDTQFALERRRLFNAACKEDLPTNQLAKG